MWLNWFYLEKIVNRLKRNKWSNNGCNGSFNTVNFLCMFAQDSSFSIFSSTGYRENTGENIFIRKHLETIVIFIIVSGFLNNYSLKCYKLNLTELEG